jgi:hypothetical protein
VNKWKLGGKIVTVFGIFLGVARSLDITRWFSDLHLAFIKLHYTWPDEKFLNGLEAGVAQDTLIMFLLSHAGHVTRANQSSTLVEHNHDGYLFKKSQITCMLIYRSLKSRSSTGSRWSHPASQPIAQSGQSPHTAAEVLILGTLTISRSNTMPSLCIVAIMYMVCTRVCHKRII